MSGSWLVAVVCGNGCWFLVGAHYHWVVFCILAEFLLIYYFNVLFILF